MAWDPNQGQGQEQAGNAGQGQSTNGRPEPDPGYSAPQNPYEGQGQPPSGADPYSGYGTPQNPYGPPPQNPYASPPPQNPYATPPQNPYGAPPQYGTPPYQQGGYAYGYAPPQQAPRSIGQAIQELPSQYIKVLTKPSAQTFAEEMGKADWGMVWIQLIALALIGTVLGLIGSAIGVASNPFTNTGTFNPSAFLAFTVSGSIFSIISVPLGFFIIVGIQYLLAKAFQGQGTFLAQSYTRTLFDVPLGIARYVLGIIPILGGVIGFALSIYGIVLNVFSLMAVHRLSGGRATLVVLLPIIVLYAALFLCIFAFVVLILAAASHGTTTPYP
jgi:hypothetical protein